jgi:hypothetical protein
MDTDVFNKGLSQTGFHSPSLLTKERDPDLRLKQADHFFVNYFDTESVNDLSTL